MKVVVTAEELERAPTPDSLSLPREYRGNVEAYKLVQLLKERTGSSRFKSARQFVDYWEFEVA